MPSVSVGDGYNSRNGTMVGAQPWTYIVRGQDTHELLGTLSWIKGSHELKFGGEVRDHIVNFSMPGPEAFNFDYSSTSQTPFGNSGGDAMASFLTGVGLTNNGSYEVASAFSSSNTQWGGFVQDNWKASRTLTVNLGLRYDVTVPRTERYNR
jgi:outer membrane receptor protein involved in Fe transport